MHATIMITNGGPHPASYWATTTADHILQIGQEVRAKATAGDAEAQAIVAVRERLETTLSDLHAGVMGNERAIFDHDGDGHLGSPLDPEELLDDSVAAVMAVFKGTPFEAHWGTQDHTDYLRRLFKQHFKAVMDIERSWFADRHPDSEVCKAFKQARMDHGPLKAPEIVAGLTKAKPKAEAVKNKR